MSVVDGDHEIVVVDYAYDAFNQLVFRRSDRPFDGNPSSTVFVQDGGQVVLQFDRDDWDDLGEEDLSHRYLWGQAIDQLIADEFVFDLEDAEENETLWALTDRQGSVTDMVDNNGVARLHRVFDSYGNILSETHFDDEGEEVSKLDPGYLDEAFAYTGRLFDKDTGLQNNLNRWYDAAIGRWMSEDPIGFAGGDANLYRYVGNSPTNFVDPEGLKHDTAKEKAGYALECIRSVIPQCGFEVTYSDGTSQTGNTSDGLRKAMYRLPLPQ